MNLLRDAPMWAHLLLILLLLAAAAQDVVQRRISNWLCLGVIILAIAAALAVGPTLTLWQNVLLFAAVLLASLPLFAAGWLGGGDVKLIAAVALWASLANILALLALILLAGGIIALVSIMVRKKRLRKSAKGVPYGVAVAAGTALLLARPMLFEAQRTPANPLDLHAARGMARP